MISARNIRFWESSPINYTMRSSSSREPSSSYVTPLLLISLSITISLSILTLTRLLTILFRLKSTSLSPKRPPVSRTHLTHLLVVLGSGGHTAEMLNMLRRLPLLPANFSHRTYVVSSGDGFSALKAEEFEMEMAGRRAELAQMGGEGQALEIPSESYDIVTVRRARRVHQGLLSTPWSASLCLWDCITVLQGAHSDQFRFRRQQLPELRKPKYPDLVLTNGPGTGVCVVLASLVLLFFGLNRPSSSSSSYKNGKRTSNEESEWRHSGQMRTIFIESWARVRTLSLSGKILLPLVDRFLVQWPGLEGSGGGKAEFVGALVG